MRKATAVGPRAAEWTWSSWRDRRTSARGISSVQRPSLRVGRGVVVRLRDLADTVAAFVILAAIQFGVRRLAPLLTVQNRRLTPFTYVSERRYRDLRGGSHQTYSWSAGT
jgi:hypothetical protein